MNETEKLNRGKAGKGIQGIVCMTMALCTMAGTLFAGDYHPDSSGWPDLFAADLSNADNPQGVWTVTDGVFTASKDQVLWTKKTYKNYVLDLEFKTEEGSNSGVILHCSNPKKWIPNSIEVQIADDFSDKWAKAHPTWQCGAIFGHLAPTKSAVKKPGEWSRYTITSKDGVVTVVLNGEQVSVMDMKKWTSAKTNPDGSKIPPWLSKPVAELKAEGQIGLQGKHAGAPIWFRKIKIQTGDGAGMLQKGRQKKQVMGAMKAFRGAPRFDLQQLFSGERFPNVVVALDGTVVASWGRNRLQVRRSEDGGESWGEPITVGPGIQGGGMTVDETSGDILVFVEDKHPPAPLTVYRSKDSGKTWKTQETTIRPDVNGHVPTMHMNEHGLTLRQGKHAGRLIRPARHYGKGNGREFWPTHYTTAIYSDDGGKTWETSDPFPEFGTGEACIVELSDGRLYYNSRRHWAPEGKNPRRRWHALSRDGGKSWEDVSICKVLPDGAQYRDYGLMGGLVRLPVEGRDILIFSNIISQKGRTNGHVWASLDGGKTWPLKRLVFEGAFAYSSLTAGRSGTATERLIYLFFEGGPKGGGSMARFNLSWVLKGEPTGDGKLPVWMEADSWMK